MRSLIVSHKMFVKSSLWQEMSSICWESRWLHQRSASKCGYRNKWEHSQHNFQQNSKKTSTFHPNQMCIDTDATTRGLAP